MYCNPWVVVSTLSLYHKSPSSVITLDASQRGLRSRVNMTILFILHALFCLTSALWALEVAQLIGLDQLLLNPKDSSTDEKFNVFYALIARETKITSVLFKSQVSLCDGVLLYGTHAHNFLR